MPRASNEAPVEQPVGLVVDSNPAVRSVLKDAIERFGASCVIADGAEAARRSARERVYDLLFVSADVAPPVVDELRRGSDRGNGGPVAVRVGACDRISDRTTWFDCVDGTSAHDDLSLAVRRAVEFARERRDNDRLRERLSLREGFRGVVGTGHLAAHLRDTIERLSSSEGSVWVWGSEGSGRTAVARALHEAGDRSRFVRLDPGILAHAVGESRKLAGEGGLLEQAAGGTLLVDGFEELEPTTQREVLDALRHPSAAGVRVICRAQTAPVEAVARGRLEPDAARTLAAEVVRVPDLRDRSEDIPVLARYFVEGVCRLNGMGSLQLAEDALDLLRGYAWPGNVAELRHALEHAVILAREGVIRAGDLPDKLRSRPGGGDGLSDRPFREAKRQVVGEFERRYLTDLLERHGGNVTTAAQQSGMLRSALQRLLRKYGLKSADFRARSRGDARRGQAPDEGPRAD